MQEKSNPVGSRNASRVAYVEVDDNEIADTPWGFWRRAQEWCWSNNMPVDEVLTDNCGNFCSDAFAAVLAERAIVLSRPNQQQSRTVQPHPYRRVLVQLALGREQWRAEAEAETGRLSVRSLNLGAPDYLTSRLPAVDRVSDVQGSDAIVEFAHHQPDSVKGHRFDFCRAEACHFLAA